jgi:hypothetical protein
MEPRLVRKCHGFMACDTRVQYGKANMKSFIDAKPMALKERRIPSKRL